IEFGPKNVLTKLVDNILSDKDDVVAIAVNVWAGWAYLASILPAWATIVIVMLATSILHELEHDLIHRLYFKHHAVIHNGMMLGVWLFRGNIINPWYRRKIHLLHHQVSGQERDIEERLIGNGRSYGFLRILAMLETSWSMLPRYFELKQIPGFSLRTMQLVALPVTAIFMLLWNSFVLFHLVDWIANVAGMPINWPQSLLDTMQLVNFLAVVTLLPNVLRQACLNLVTTNVHYFGDVNNLLQQTQIVRHKALWPLQLFCFNFGATHALHHYYIKQPFYLRQMIASSVYPIVKDLGVRFNDMSSPLRANRYARATPSQGMDSGQVDGACL
ncbi:MAG: fatty acid desaturase, partial [Pseudomonadales bacterium]|nr:fatty acid desaturase [Pseudomonadales bacterium]